jgi:hypothetical protein
MKITVLLLLSSLIFLSGCSGSSEPSFEDKYAGWISQENFAYEPLPLDLTVWKNDEPCWRNVFAVYAYVYCTIQYTSEPEGEDHWQTAQETMDSGMGDCEDIAILFYSTLFRYGFPEDEMDLFLLQKDTGEYHVSVGFYDAGSVSFPNPSIDANYTIVYAFNY